MQYNITYREKDKGIQFIISYKDSAGKWKQKSKQGFKTKREAKAAADQELDKLKETLKLQVDLSKEHEGITFKEFTHMFIEHEKLYKEWNTINTYETSFKVFRDLDELEINKIKTTDIQKSVDNLIKRGLKIITIKRYLSKIDMLFKSAQNKYKIIVKNPVINIDIPKDKNKTEKTALTKHDLELLLSKITNRKYYIISLLASKCGLRLGEILGLTWSDVDDKKCIINISKQWKKLKDGSYGFGDLKSVNSKRIIPISPNIIKELNKYKNESPLNYDGRLFSNISNKDLSETLALTYKNIGYDISIHELRHTYATMLISNGIDFKTAAKLLGHDVKQTLNTYSHVTDDMLNNASKIINTIFN